MDAFVTRKGVIDILALTESIFGYSSFDAFPLTGTRSRAQTREIKLRASSREKGERP